MANDANSTESPQVDHPMESEAERQARILRSMVVHADTDEFVGFAASIDHSGKYFPLRLR